MKNAYIIILSLLLWACASTQTSTPNGKEEGFSGTVKKKEWAKSGQSYCAGGSEYFVLVLGNGDELVLSKDGASYHKAWEAFANKQVAIEGALVEKRIAPDPNEISQRPAGEGDFVCQVLEVKEIALR